MKRVSVFLFLIIALLSNTTCDSHRVRISGDMKKWHKVTLSIKGPQTSETGVPNPFLDYRLNVTFTHGLVKYVVPGFFSADGRSFETSAESGNIWQVRFRPDFIGEWKYQVSFRSGPYIAVSDSFEIGQPVYGDGTTGTFVIQPDEDEPFSKGKLLYVGERYLRYAETGEYFLKAGADSPENFLAYKDFDGTFYGGDGKRRLGEAGPNENLHSYSPHAKDWKNNDPTWQNGKGKNIIGALNYLAAQGMNSVYFLTMNFHGDGKDVWPWINPYERTRFDCSKLDQWEIVFDHMDKLGLMLHVVTQETENELLLDNGYTGVLRKLYYRELVARFSHHLAVTWNLGEENGPAEFTPNAQNDDMRKQMAEYIKTHDPYKNFVSLHTHHNDELRDPIFKPLLGFEYLDGPSLQIGDPQQIHRVTKKWIDLSQESGKPWVCFSDEIGGADTGVLPDSDDPQHDQIRKHVLWGNLMAGGGGNEWYFGYKYANNDLNCEDWRSRENMWTLTKIAIDFFQKYVPYTTMYSSDDLVSGDNNWCFAQPGVVYVVYLPNGGTSSIELARGDYTVHWYNPRAGGDLLQGTIAQQSGPGKKLLGYPPENNSEDWVVLLKKIED